MKRMLPPQALNLLMAFVRRSDVSSDWVLSLYNSRFSYFPLVILAIDLKSVLFGAFIFIVFYYTV